MNAHQRQSPVANREAAADTGFAALDDIQPRRGAEMLVEVLRSEGLRYVFGNPGTTELSFIDALSDAPDLSYVLGLQEAAVVAMAEAVRRLRAAPSTPMRTGARARGGHRPQRIVPATR